MIVSFVMSLLTFQECPYLWFFYKSIDMARKCNWAVIAQEEYYKNPEEFKRNGRVEAYDEQWIKNAGLNYDVPLDVKYEELNCHKIPDSLCNRIVDDVGSYKQAQLKLISERIEYVEEFIDNIIVELNNKIDCFVTLCDIPSLNYIAEKYNIPVVHIEMGALREPAYIKTGYFDFGSLYGNSFAEKRFLDFKNCVSNIKHPLLNNKDILTLFLKKEYMFYVKHYDDKATYKAGVALGYAVWPMFQNNSMFDDEELLYRLSKKYDYNEMLVRKHPADPVGAMYPKFDYCRDSSFSTIDFILQCERIYSVGSNVSAESKLYGKTAYTITRSPGYFGTIHSLSKEEHEENQCLENNFYFIAYLAPFSLLWDDNYIKWRLTNPSEIEIYNRHLYYYLKEKNIPYDILLLDENDRYLNIASAQGVDLRDSKYNIPLKVKKYFTIRHYQNEIERLKKLLKENENE